MVGPGRNPDIVAYVTQATRYAADVHKGNCAPDSHPGSNLLTPIMDSVGSGVPVLLTPENQPLFCNGGYVNVAAVNRCNLALHGQQDLEEAHHGFKQTYCFIHIEKNRICQYRRT